MNQTTNKCAMPLALTSSFTNKLDNFVLNRFLGIPIFLALIYLVFSITIQGGGAIQGLMSGFLQDLLIEKVAVLLHSYLAPDWAIGLLSAGLGQGLHTTLCFIPVIASMFFCLAFLEATGYMLRAASVMDKVMNKVGLSGKSFMPMILGFGCNVPAILGTRSLEDPKQRILTIMMTPFMSCGARLAIYALFVAAFFPENGANIIFALYMIGILMALFTAWILGKVLLTNETTKSAKSPLDPSSHHSSPHLELPSYRLPNIPKLLLATYARVKSFVLNAGMIIIPLCMLIGSLSVIKTEGQESYMTRIGRHITPIFAPMGIEENNWPATVGLLSGLLAKEVMVGTLTALYAEPNNKSMDACRNSTVNSVTEVNTLKSSLGSLVHSFGSKAAAFAYLLFVLMYFPCVSVLATISRELNFSWALFSSIWTTGNAYAISVLFYQTATFSHHPSHSIALISIVLLALGLGLIAMKKWAKQVIKKQSKGIFPTRIIILES